MSEGGTTARLPVGLVQLGDNMISSSGGSLVVFKEREGTSKAKTRQIYTHSSIKSLIRVNDPNGEKSGDKSFVLAVSSRQATLLRLKESTPVLVFDAADDDDEIVDAGRVTVLAMHRIKKEGKPGKFRVRLSIPFALRSGRLRLMEISADYFVSHSISKASKMIEETSRRGQLKYCVHLNNSMFFGVFEDTVVKSDGSVTRAGEVSLLNKRRVAVVAREMWKGKVLLMTESGSIRVVQVDEREGRKTHQLTILCVGHAVPPYCSLHFMHPTVIISTATTVVVGTATGEIHCLDEDLGLTRLFHTDGGTITSLYMDENDDNWLWIAYESGEVRKIHLSSDQSVLKPAQHSEGSEKMEIGEREESDDNSDPRERIFGPPLPSSAMRLMLPRDQKIKDGETGIILLVLAHDGSLYVTRENKFICLDKSYDSAMEVDTSVYCEDEGGRRRNRQVINYRSEDMRQWVNRIVARPWASDELHSEMDGEKWMRLRGKYRDMYVFDDFVSSSSCVAYGDNEAMCCGGTNCPSDLTKLVSTRRIITALCWKKTFAVQLDGGLLVVKYLGNGNKVLVVDMKARKGVRGSTVFDETITTMAVTLSGKPWESLIFLGTDRGRLYRVVGIPCNSNSFSIDDILERTRKYEQWRKEGDRPGVWSVEEVFSSLSSVGDLNSPVVSIQIVRGDEEEGVQKYPRPILVVYANGFAVRAERDGSVQRINSKSGEDEGTYIKFVSGANYIEDMRITMDKSKLICSVTDEREKKKKKKIAFELEKCGGTGRIEGNLALFESTVFFIKNGKVLVKMGEEEIE